MNEAVLITNGRIWPGPGAEVMPSAGLRIREGRIDAVGPLQQGSERIIDARGALVMPGLIQSHVHLCQTLFRGVAEDLPLLPWLRDYIWPLEAAHNEKSIRASAQLAVAEMLRGGTTAFMSMETVHHTDAALEEVGASGIMGILCHCLMDETGGYPPLAVSIDDSLKFCDGLIRQTLGNDRLRIGVAPRFALSCSGDNLRAATEYARSNGLQLHTHASEQEEEVNLVYRQTGMHNIDYLHSVGLTGPDVGLAHCVHTQIHEREIMAETQTRVLHCPSANLKLGSGVAPIPEYLDMGLKVSLGADGAPCNNRLDAFLEMREAALIQQPRLGPGSLAAVEVVRMATEMGAESLNLQSEMGTLEPGKRANLIFVDQDTLHALPTSNPATDLVYSHAAADVRLTMVDGQVLYQDGELKTIDEEKLRKTVRLEQKALLERAGLA